MKSAVLWIASILRLPCREGFPAVRSLGVSKPCGAKPVRSQPEGTKMNFTRRNLLLLAAAIGIAGGPAYA
ncbi:MAG: hypothetical protein E5W69_04230, partial [Mesorhizobium sp.]